MTAFTEEVLFPHGREPWQAEDLAAARRLPNSEDEWLVIRPMLFSLRLAVMTEDNASVEHWCYTSFHDAFLSWCVYPNVLDGWTRHHTRDGEMVHP